MLTSRPGQSQSARMAGVTVTTKGHTQKMATTQMWVHFQLCLSVAGITLSDTVY